MAKRYTSKYVNGELLRRLIETKPTKPTRVAEKAKVGLNTVYKMMDGGPCEVELIKRVAAYLGVAYETLLQVEEPTIIKEVNVSIPEILTTPITNSETFLTQQSPVFSASVPLFDRRRMEDLYYAPIEIGLMHEFHWRQGRASLVVFVLRELMNNGFEHGCRGAGDLEVSFTVQVERSGEYMVLTVISPGEGFDFARVIGNTRGGMMISGGEELEKERDHGLKLVSQIAHNLVSSSEGRTIQATIYREPLEANLHASVLTIDNKNIAVLTLPRVVSMEYDYYIDKEKLIEIIERHNVIGGIIDSSTTDYVDSPGLWLYSKSLIIFKKKKLKHIVVASEKIADLMRILRIPYELSMRDAVSYITHES